MFAAESLPTTVPLVNSNFTGSSFNESEASGARQGLYRKVLSPSLRGECGKVGLQAKYFEKNGCERLAKPWRCRTLLKSNFAVSLFDESEASEAHSGCFGKVLSRSLQIKDKKVGLQAKVFE